MKFVIKTSPQTKNVLQKMQFNSGAFRKRVQAALDQVGVDATRYITTGIEREPKKGIHYTKAIGKDGRLKLYKRKGKYAHGRLHKASAAGQFPAIVNSDYIKSINYSVQGFSRVEFGSNDTKADWLEFGTRKMAPREPVTRAFKERQKNAFNYLRWENILKNIK